MSDWHFVFLIILFVGTSALATSAPQGEEDSLSSRGSMETLDLSKKVEGDEPAEANSGISFNVVQLPTETGKNRQQLMRDIVKRDKQRLQYFASRIERAKFENSQNQHSKLKGLAVAKDENGGSQDEQVEKTSTFGSADSN